MKTYLVRLFNQDMKLTLEDHVEAPTLSEAIEKAKALKNDVNASQHYGADFYLKAITIEQHKTTTKE